MKIFKYANKKIVNSLLTAILLIIMSISFVKIIFWIKDNKKNDSVVKNVQKIAEQSTEENVNENEKLIDFSKLLEKYNNTIAWIKLNNTVINYPVVKYTDNDYYLNHSFDNSNNSGGWIFMDYRNTISDKNIIIYGHNRKDGSMFGGLKKILNKDRYNIEDNRKITFSIPNENKKYMIYSAFTVKDEDVENYLKINFESDESFKSFINSTTKYNQLNIKTDVSSINNIITLYTCSGTGVKLLVFAYEI